jgi:AraC-like DNA-binding protein
MEIIRSSTDGLAPESQFSHWLSIFSRSFSGVRLRSVFPSTEGERRGNWRGRFHGSLETAWLNDVCYGKFCCDAHSLVADFSSANRSLAVFQQSGVTHYKVGTTKVILRPGQWLLIDGCVTARVEHSSRVEALAIQLPRRTLDMTSAIHLFSGEHGVQWLTFNFVKDAFSVLSHLSAAKCTLGEHVCELIRLSVDEHANDDASPARARAGQLDGHAILRFIQRNLPDPSLSLDAIASRFGCSKRTLHRSFQAVCDMTVERYLWHARIERCAQELSGTFSITEIAYKYGFSDSAHFSRMFRQRYGLSPRAYIKAQASCQSASDGSAALHQGTKMGSECGGAASS